MKMHTFWFECTDNGGGHQGFVVKAENKQEAIKKGMAFAKKHASGDICGDWECKMIFTRTGLRMTRHGKEVW